MGGISVYGQYWSAIYNLASSSPAFYLFFSLLTANLAEQIILLFFGHFKASQDVLLFLALSSCLELSLLTLDLDHKTFRQRGQNSWRFRVDLAFAVENVFMLDDSLLLIL